MQRWNPDESDRSWVTRRFRDDQGSPDEGATADDAIDLRDDAADARVVNGRDFSLLRRLRAHR